MVVGIQKRELQSPAGYNIALVVTMKASMRGLLQHVIYSEYGLQRLEERLPEVISRCSNLLYTKLCHNRNCQRL